MSKSWFLVTQILTYMYGISWIISCTLQILVGILAYMWNNCPRKNDLRFANRDMAELKGEAACANTPTIENNNDEADIFKTNDFNPRIRIKHGDEFTFFEKEVAKFNQPSSSNFTKTDISSPTDNLNHLEYGRPWSWTEKEELDDDKKNDKAHLADTINMHPFKSTFNKITDAQPKISNVKEIDEDVSCYRQSKNIKCDETGKIKTLPLEYFDQSDVISIKRNAWEGNSDSSGDTSTVSGGTLGREAKCQDVLTQHRDECNNDIKQIINNLDIILKESSSTYDNISINNDLSVEDDRYRTIFLEETKSSAPVDLISWEMLDEKLEFQEGGREIFDNHGRMSRNLLDKIQGNMKEDEITKYQANVFDEMKDSAPVDLITWGIPDGKTEIELNQTENKEISEKVDQKNGNLPANIDESVIKRNESNSRVDEKNYNEPQDNTNVKQLRILPEENIPGSGDVEKNRHSFDLKEDGLSENDLIRSRKECTYRIPSKPLKLEKVTDDSFDKIPSKQFLKVSGYDSEKTENDCSNSMNKTYNHNSMIFGHCPHCVPVESEKTIGEDQAVKRISSNQSISHVYYDDRSHTSKPRSVVRKQLQQQDISEKSSKTTEKSIIHADDLNVYLNDSQYGIRLEKLNVSEKSDKTFHACYRNKSHTCKPRSVARKGLEQQNIAEKPDKTSHVYCKKTHTCKPRSVFRKRLDQQSISEKSDQTTEKRVMKADDLTHTCKSRSVFRKRLDQHSIFEKSDQTTEKRVMKADDLSVHLHDPPDSLILEQLNASDNSDNFTEKRVNFSEDNSIFSYNPDDSIIETFYYFTKTKEKEKDGKKEIKVASEKITEALANDVANENIKETSLKIPKMLSKIGKKSRKIKDTSTKTIEAHSEILEKSIEMNEPLLSIKEMSDYENLEFADVCEPLGSFENDLMDSTNQPISSEKDEFLKEEATLIDNSKTLSKKISNLTRNAEYKMKKWFLGSSVKYKRLTEDE